MALFTAIDTITWSAFSPAADVVPDVDTEVNIEGATIIAVQGDSTAAGNISDDNDINVELSLNGTKFDTQQDISMNLGDNQIKTLFITPGAKKLRLRADNNHAASNDALSAIVKVDRF